MKTKFKNKLEETVSKYLKLPYESNSYKYIIEHSYTPDFIDEKNKVWYDTKGYLNKEDRRKFIALKKQYPDWLIVLIFQKPNNKLSKAKNSLTYAQWANRNNILWVTPEELKNKYIDK